MALIDVQDLRTYFYTAEGVVKAVDGVDFKIMPERTLGVVGESGCGKSVTARSIMRIIPSPPGKIEGGKIMYNSPDGMVDITTLEPTSSRMRLIRGNEIAMIFQEPMTSLNPAYTVGNQIMEPIILHQGMNKSQAEDKAIEMLKLVGIPAPDQRINEYPHQLSGGMRQRAMIAMALSCNPALLIADEPTTALDVTIQAQVLDLMNKLRSDYKTAIMFITHDLGVIANMADDVIVMYLGKVVESAPVDDIFENPKHPYTQGLMNSIPSLTSLEKKRLQPITGNVPDPHNQPKGCGFEPRCSQSKDICKEQKPGLSQVAPGHSTACWLYQ
jgi:oligopeptide/dipeptide ABC transporter ATP-binding protein